jgi:fatty acid desaturase
MLPQAWDVEHNKLHHYYLSEDKDPDLVERNFEILQELSLPVALKYASMFVWVLTWKFTYYSPNTYKELQLSRQTSWVARNWPASTSKADPLTVAQFVQYPALALFKGAWFELIFWPRLLIQWIAMIAPMLASVVLPAAIPLVLSSASAWSFATPATQVAWRMLISVVLADLMSNAHSFVIVVCNHAGEDLYRYSSSVKPYSAEWFLRCAYSSANFETGSELVDVLYGWLNYQIEHHMFPDMTPLQYRKLQPLMKSVCQKHGVQYVQQNGFFRTWKMLRVAVGSAKMQSCTALLHPRKEEQKIPESFVVDPKATGA